MNSNRHKLDGTIRDAIAKHGEALDGAVPDFAALIAVRQRRTRRTLAATTVAVVLLGIGGVVLATSRDQTPADAVMDAGATPEVPATAGVQIETTAVDDTTSTDDTTTTTSRLSLPPVVTVAATEPTEYFCTDSLGEDQLGRALFGSCEPNPGRTDSDYACTDRIGTDDTGRMRFATCEAVGRLGPISGGDDDAPFDDSGDLPVRPTTYVVQPGDYGLKVAAEFCVSIAELEVANGWIDNSREFPVPGAEILIPVGGDETTCALNSYTVTSDDTTRIGVADKFCISVQALDTANIETEGYTVFFPGLVIVIPPSFDDTC